MCALFTGMFFQWVTCAAIWVTSMIGDLVLQSPKFCPFAMVGGVLWATGTMGAELPKVFINVFCVYCSWMLLLKTSHMEYLCSSSPLSEMWQF